MKLDSPTSSIAARLLSCYDCVHIDRIQRIVEHRVDAYKQRPDNWALRLQCHPPDAHIHHLTVEPIVARLDDRSGVQRNTSRESVFVHVGVLH